MWARAYKLVLLRKEPVVKGRTQGKCESYFDSLFLDEPSDFFELSDFCELSDFPESSDLDLLSFFEEEDESPLEEELEEEGADDFLA